MKRIFIACAMLFPMAVYAAAPSTSCPAGYVQIVERGAGLYSTACPSGTVSAGTVSSCLVSSPAGVCMMFVPEYTTYSDETGEYYFTDICPLE